MNLTKEKQKKIVLFVGLPAIIILLLTVAYFGINGFENGKSDQAQAQGINTKLPSPAIEDQRPLDKLSIYLQAEKDSAEKAQQIIKDPFFRNLSDSNPHVSREVKFPNAEPDDIRSFSWQQTQTQNERLLQDKLNLLREQLDNNSATLSTKQPDKISLSNLPDEFPTAAHHYEQPPAANPDLVQIDSVLNKILDIQYPQRIAEKYTGPITKNDIKPLFVSNRSGADSLLWHTDFGGVENSKPLPTRNRFYELEDFSIEDTANVIAATIYGTQEVTNGMTVTLRLDQEVYLGHQTIPAGTLVWGEGHLVQDRFAVTIKNISFKNSFFPVDMEVFSRDGISGIPISGAMSHQAAKLAMDRGAQSLQITSLSPSLAAQAASAGIESAKSLLSKKAKLIKVTLKDGHPVLLKNSSNGK
ncbi:conjugative transposon protein TraM [Niastella sp. OAS944]|uniref:conjugative transposon protein TraM n=1 Tax=Niastella sp. OAS944 TaxID=2664089 RepID=UPI00347E1258|nr:conjugative transposon TraM protein [Chitinophagaceae bacterium OAS944]